jgi:hypothetical protein
MFEMRRPRIDHRCNENYPSRREFLASSATGFGSLALSGLLAGCKPTYPPNQSDPIKTRKSAKSVIFLYMEGGPSQMDTFDPKPRLKLDDGKPIPLGHVPNRLSRERILASPFAFKQHGESGIAISELFPHLAKHADQLTVIRSMVAKNPDHGSANYFMHTGNSLRGRPSIGSWFSYGLGTETQNLPSYVVMNDGEQLTGGEGILSNGFLPPRFGPTLLRTGANPIANLTPREMMPELQEQKLEAIKALNQQSKERTGNENVLDSVIANYELAFRMQTSIIEAADIRNETPATKQLYGLDEPMTETFGRACLRARRLVERGVRFVQLVSPPCEDQPRWDQHTDLVLGHRRNSLRVDKPIAGLLEDLHTLGLLDSTLVVWGGEFGRTPTSQNTFLTRKVGRDHNPTGFTMWLAGGGLKRGHIHGATDEFGFQSVENPVSVHDLHATILHLFGIDHTELTYRYGGRDYRLTDVHGEVVKEIIAS